MMVVTTRTSPTTLRALALAVLVVPLLFFLLFAGWSYREHFRQAEGRMVRTLDLLHEHGSKVFETYDLLASYVNELLSDLPDEQVRDREAALNERLRRYKSALPQVQDIWVVSGAGRPLVTANVYPVPRDLDLTDRGYFVAHREKDAGVYLSDVLRGRVQNVTFFQFARRRASKDGRFNGVIAISVQPDYFRNYYAQVAANGLSSGALQREDGTLLARFPGLPETTQPVATGSAFQQARERNADRGLYTVVSGFDGIERRIAYRRVPGYPVYVSVGLHTASVHAAWRWSLVWPLALVLPATLALFGLTRLAARQMQRESAAVEVAAQETRRREQAEAERRKTDALHRAYFDNTSEAQFVIGVHPDGRFTVEDRNRAHETAIGFDLEQVRGRDIREVLPPDLASEVVAHYQACVDQGRPVRFEMDVGYGSAASRWETVLAPVFEQGRITHLIGASRDLTARVQLEAALRESQKMEALSRLVSGVAHDFNNILQVVRGNLDLLKRAPEERRARLIENASRATEQGRKITGQLLAFGRRQALKPEVINANLLIAEMDDMLAQTLRGDIQMRFDLAEGLWPVEVDVSQMQVALINIAANARDAMPKGGVFTVSTANTVLRDGDTVECVSLSVADTGTGMSPEVLARVGEPFFSTRKEAGQGNGLGMAQVLGFVHQSGGRVDIRSEEGRGTTVTLVLPRAHKQVVVGEQPGPVTAKIADLAVLLVEDNPQVAEVGASILADQGHRVTVVSSADEALKRLRVGSAFDVIVSDLVMPGRLDGLDLAREVRGRWPEVPVLLVSGYSDRATQAKGDGFTLLSKPYSPDALAEEIARLMDTRNAATRSNVVQLHAR